MSSRRRRRPTNSPIVHEEAKINAVWNHLKDIPGGDIEGVLKEVKHHKTFMQHRWIICYLQQNVYMLRGELQRLIDEERNGISTTEYFPVEVSDDEPREANSNGVENAGDEAKDAESME